MTESESEQRQGIYIATSDSTGCVTTEVAFLTAGRETIIKFLLNYGASLARAHLFVVIPIVQLVVDGTRQRRVEDARGVAGQQRLVVVKAFILVHRRDCFSHSARAGGEGHIGRQGRRQ